MRTYYIVEDLGPTYSLDEEPSESAVPIELSEEEYADYLRAEDEWARWHGRLGAVYQGVRWERPRVKSPD